MIPTLLFCWKNKRPKFVLIIDDAKNIKKFVYLWHNNTVKEALKKDRIIKNIMIGYDSFLTNGYKAVLEYYGDDDYGDVYDFPIENNISEREIVEQYNKNKLEFGKEWQLIRGNAAYVYYLIEKRGIVNEYKTVYPKYSMDVSTGRSKTTGVVIQGFDDSYNIKHPNQSYDILINFDWISADFRIAAILSKDENLLESFKSGDPYQYIENQLDGQMSRNDCKVALLQATYSLDYDSEIFIIYPKFGNWIKEQSNQLKISGFTESILGRKFYYDGTFKSEKRCVNAIMQGSVAHAMNSVIYNAYKKCGEIILTEQHDSLTVATTSNMVPFVVKTISEIMFKPFESLDVVMPLKISIGKRWNSYKYFKECR